MKMVLTKRRTLELTAELWLWLSQNPWKFKHDWPGWRECEAVYGFITCFCLCCAFGKQEHYMEPEDAEEHDEGKCRYCPLKGYAWSDRCDDGDEVYFKWRSSTSEEERAECAKVIYEGCRAALVDLDKQEGKVS